MAAANKNIRRTSVDKASLFVNQTDNDSHVSIDVIDLSYNQGALFLKDAENFLRRRASDSMQRFIPRINAYVSQKIVIFSCHCTGKLTCFYVVSSLCGMCCTG
mgnify:CR=1 FL=1